jgi:hypothetical protein
MHWKENPLCVFLFWELRGLNPNFHNHVSLSDLYTVVPGLVHIVPPAEEADQLWEYINLSQTHECGNWDRVPAIPFLGIFVSKFWYFVFAV